jgi:hypothetical protein
MLAKARRVGPWLGSLSASALIHFALFASVILIALKHTPAPRVEPADRWVGAGVVVDTVGQNELPTVPAALPAPQVPHAAAPLQRAPAPKAEPKIIQAHARTSEKTADNNSAAHEDPNAALMQKVMAFHPSSGSSHEQETIPSQQQPAAAAISPGSSGETAGVRNLSKAFTRALANAAAGTARVWARLPTGKADEAEITVVVNETGAVMDHGLNRDASERMKDLVRRTVESLGAGQFALKQLHVSAGTMKLRVTVWLSGGESEDAQGRVSEIGYQAPLPGREGKAYFTLGEGWHFEAKVREL